MWQLYMVLAVWYGNASIGGPIIVDGFKTEVACVSHMKKIEDATPKEKFGLLDSGRYEFLVKTCVKIDK